MLTCAGRRPRSSTRARCRRPPPRSSGASPASTAARPCPRPGGAAASSPARARGTAANVRRLNKTIVTLSQQQQTIFLAPNTSQNMQKTLVRFLLVTQYSLPLFGKRHKTLLFPTLSAQLGRKQLLMEKLTWLWFQQMGSRTCRENQGMIGLMMNVSRKLK